MHQEPRKGTTRSGAFLLRPGATAWESPRRRFMSRPVLSVQHLVTSFHTERGSLRAVDDVSFDVPRGAAVGIVGESGCGKSVTSLSIMRLLPQVISRIDSGKIWLDGQDLGELSEREMQKVRGKRLGMIFQEPMTSLNPVYTVGAQIAEAIRLHEPVSRREAKARAIAMLEKVGIPDPGARVNAYPHELSGGMRQRVMIAMALVLSPEVLLADEPTTALDVTIQAQILDLLRRLSKELGMSIVLVTHDLGVVAEFVESVVVMYAGRVVEAAPVGALFAKPLHPYTRGLLRSIPPIGAPRGSAHRPRRLPTIEGTVPSLAALPPGCRFASRCDVRIARCDEVEPAEQTLPSGRRVRCHLVTEADDTPLEHVPAAADATGAPS
jgi:peptide/nickel transport system ATP-binding protein